MKKSVFLATMLAFAFAVLLLPAVTMAQSVFSVSPTRLDFGSVQVGSTGSIALTVTNNDVSTKRLEGGTLLAFLSKAPNKTFPADFELTGSGVSVQFTKERYTLPPNVGDTTLTGNFSNYINLAPGQSTVLTCIIKPLIVGARVDTLDIYQNGPLDPTLPITVTGVLPPSLPSTPAPIPGIAISKGTETVGLDGSVNVRLLWDWRVIEPVDIELDFGDGSPVYRAKNANDMPAHVYAQAGTYPLKLRVKDLATGLASNADSNMVFPTPLPAEPVVFVPPDPVPAASPFQESQSSTMAVSEKAGGRSEKHPGGYWGRAGKPLAGIQSESWGRIKNQRVE